MAGVLVDTYGNVDGSDADKWSAVAKWVVRTEGAVPGGPVFTSSQWTQSCCLVRRVYHVLSKPCNQWHHERSDIVVLAV